MDQQKQLLVSKWQQTSLAANLEHSGPAERLWQGCVEIYSGLLRSLKREAVVSPSMQKKIETDFKLFALWGDGFQSQDGGLDLILQQSKRLQQMTVCILVSVGTKLQSLIDIVFSSMEIRNGILQAVGMPSLLEQARLTISEAQNGPDEAERDFETAVSFEDILEDLTTCVQCLVDLGPSLEYPAKDPEYEEKARGASLEDARAGFYSFCSMIEHRFPRAERALTESLGRTNWNRYLRLQASRESRATQDLSQYKKQHEDDGSTLAASTVASSSGFEDSGVGSSLSGPEAHRPIRDAAFELSLVPNVDDRTRPPVPSLSAAAKGGMPFECDACGQIIKVKSRREWKEHIYQDLWLYSCPFERCSFNETLFNERELFINHLEFAHRTMLGDGGTCSLCFDTLATDRGLFAIHLLRHLEEIALAALPRVFGAESTLEAPDTDSMPSLPGDNLILGAEDVEGSIHSALETGKQYRYLPEDVHQDFHDESLKKDQVPARSSETEPEEMIEQEDFLDSENRQSKPWSTSLSVRHVTIIPTLEGFESHARQLNTHLQSFLIHRIGSEQLRRYNRLVDLKLKHDYAIATGKCPSGKHCFAQGGKATMLAPLTSDTGPGTTYVGFQHIKSDSDKTEAVAEVTVSATLFPPGIPLPPVQRLPAEFECSLCFKVKRFYKPSDWSKHVHEDIQPFTCTFPNCVEPRSFKRKADWVRHENERHRNLEWWTCNLPDCNHTCYRKDNFVQHLVREHKKPEPKVKSQKSGISSKMDDSAASNEELLEVWKLVDSCYFTNSCEPTSEVCKFCGNVCSTWKGLIIHLAKHLEQIAMPLIELVDQKAPDGK